MPRRRRRIAPTCARSRSSRCSGGLRAEIVAGRERETFEFGFTQAHNVTNALAAIGAAHALGIPPRRQLADGAPGSRFSSLRGEEIELPDGVLIINDCYNANPVSMRAALDHLAQVAARRGAARAVAVLGEMRELGPEAERYHEEIGRHAAGRGVRAGRGGRAARAPTSAATAERGRRARGRADRCGRPRSRVVRDGDVVLVKASRAVGLERVTGRSRRGGRRLMGEILIAGLASLLISIFLGPKYIQFLREREFGQHIREEGPAEHHLKAGTPTMGGLVCSPRSGSRT